MSLTNIIVRLTVVFIGRTLYVSNRKERSNTQAQNASISCKGRRTLQLSCTMAGLRQRG